MDTSSVSKIRVAPPAHGGINLEHYNMGKAVRHNCLPYHQREGGRERGVTWERDELIDKDRAHATPTREWGRERGEREVGERGRRKTEGEKE
jgi:hypothetical protein